MTKPTQNNHSKQIHMRTCAAVSFIVASLTTLFLAFVLVGGLRATFLMDLIKDDRIVQNTIVPTCCVVIIISVVMGISSLIKCIDWRGSKSEMVKLSKRADKNMLFFLAITILGVIISIITYILNVPGGILTLLIVFYGAFGAILSLIISKKATSSKPHNGLLTHLSLGCLFSLVLLPTAVISLPKYPNNVFWVLFLSSIVIYLYSYCISDEQQKLQTLKFSLRYLAIISLLFLSYAIWALAEVAYRPFTQVGYAGLAIVMFGVPIPSFVLICAIVADKIIKKKTNNYSKLHPKGKKKR